MEFKKLKKSLDRYENDETEHELQERLREIGQQIEEEEKKKRGYKIDIKRDDLQFDPILNKKKEYCSNLTPIWL